MAKEYLRCSAKARETQYGQIIKLGIKVDDFIAFARKHVNERGYLNLDIMPRKEVGQYGDTHSVVLDDYVKGSGKTAPSPAGGRYPDSTPSANYEPSPFGAGDDIDIPF